MKPADASLIEVAAEMRALLAAAEAAAAEVERDANSRAVAILAEANREAERRIDEARREASAVLAGSHRPLPPKSRVPERRVELPGELRGARFVAREMMKAGSDRAEVAAHLRRTFELPDPEDALEPVFSDGDGLH